MKLEDLADEAAVLFSVSGNQKQLTHNFSIFNLL